MENKTIAVLGSSGFLGSVICKFFCNQYKIIPVSRDVLNLNEYDAVSAWLKSQDVNIIINCATAGNKSSSDEVDYQQAKNNLEVFSNFYNNSSRFSKFINIGSGAEFGLHQDIKNIKEEEILASHPEGSYGYSKNLISRLVLEKDNFFTLRIFGCFDPSEPEHRLFKRLSNNDSINLIDREFDYISSWDFCKVLEHYINNHEGLPKDINCVYSDKLLLSSIVKKFIDIHGLSRTVNIVGSSMNYSGSSDKLESLNLNLDGLDAGIKKYKGDGRDCL